MQMLDVLKRLAELDADNPRIYNDTPTLNQQGVAEDKGDMDNDAKDERDSEEWRQNRDQAIKKSMAKEDIVDEEQVDECGMMPAMGSMNDHHTPASINITADSGDELSAMLRDIMTLAGRDHHDHADDMGMAEPMGDMPPPAEVDTDSGDDMGIDEPTMMRSMIDKLNPGDDEGGDQDGDQGDDQDDVKEYDNTPDQQTSGYSSMTPTGNDLSSKGDNEASKVNGGGNPYSRTMEDIESSLFQEYKKFINE